MLEQPSSPPKLEEAHAGPGHEVVHCPVCQSSRVSEEIVGSDVNLRSSMDSFAIFRCEDCRISFTSRLTALDASDNYYSEDYPCHRQIALHFSGFLELIRVRATGSLRYNRWCNPYLVDFENRIDHDRRVLEVGCGIGDLLTSLRAKSWIVSGIEPSSHAANIASQSGLQVTCATVEDAEVDDHSVDLIMLSHSLEHVTNPNLALKKFYRWLVPVDF